MPNLQHQSQSEVLQTSQRKPPSIEQIADQREKLDRFEKKIRYIKQDRSVRKQILAWYGGPGIGKTTLVKLLTHSCKKERVPYLLVDFLRGKHHSSDYMEDPALLIEDMILALTKKTEMDTSSLYSAIRRFRSALASEIFIVRDYYELSAFERKYNRPEWLNIWSGVIREFIFLVDGLCKDRLGDSQPLAVFFDETEYAGVQLIDWIEEWIINPLLHRKQCIIVWTSRRPQKWKSHEVKRMLKKEELQVFDLNDVKEQFVKSNSSFNLTNEFFKKVYDVTGGHPYANAIIIDTWTTQSVKITPQIFSANESELLSKVYDEFILTHAFRDCSPEMKIACELLALIRRFDATMLCKVLKACASNSFATWDEDECEYFLKKLKQTQLLVWSNGGYSLDPDLRYIIQKFLYVREPQLFIRVNQTASTVYSSWLKQPVDNRGGFIVEELYHQAALNLTGQSTDLEHLLNKRLQQYHLWFNNRDMLRLSLEQLRGTIEHDQELEQLTNGLSSTRLVKPVQKYLDDLLTRK